MVFPSPAGWNPLGIGGTRALTFNLGGTFLPRSLGSNASQPAPDRAGTRQSKQWKFPIKNACTVGALALTGDTIAQFSERIKRRNALEKAPEGEAQGQLENDLLWDHDWLRALRMGSFGFLIYGPGQHVWYQFLEKHFAGKAATNLTIKVIANQLMLGPCVLLTVFAWNFMWMKRLHELPGKYKKDLPGSLLNGWKFWIPASVINFTVVPLPARVVFMSSCSVFWNFYLSTLIGKK